MLSPLDDPQAIALTLSRLQITKVSFSLIPKQAILTVVSISMVFHIRDPQLDYGDLFPLGMAFVYFVVEYFHTLELEVVQIDISLVHLCR